MIPNISYYDGTNADLKYASWDTVAASFSVTTVESTGNVGSYTSLALDSSDRAHISYYDQTNTNLKYTYWDGSSWQIETVDSASYVGSPSSLTLDSFDRAHISYYDRTNYNLKYAYWDGTVWQIETVDSAGIVGEYNSLAVDSFDRAHIGGFDLVGSDLKYASWDGSSWQIERVDSTGSVGYYDSLALDSFDRAHISYYDGTNGDLKYAGPALVSNLTQGTWYFTISEAVAAASSGDILQVAGTSNNPVYDNVVVDVESLTIQACPGTPGLVVVADPASDILHITADYVTITGLTISGASTAAGIHLDGATNYHILSNTVINCLKGIWLQGSPP